MSVDVGSIITVAGLVGSVVGALGITKFISSKNNCTLEEHEKRLTDVEHTAILLKQVKKGQDDLITEIKSEFGKHHDLHLTIATSLGALTQAVNDLSKRGENG